MKSKTRRQERYEPMRAKTFPTVLEHFVAQEFPHLGGPKIRRLFVDEVVSLAEAHYLSRERLRPGQVVWYAVDKTWRPGRERSMLQTRLVPVVLTLVALEDIERLIRGEARPEVVSHIVARIHQEAEAQGGVLAEIDTSLLLCYNHETISQAILRYESQHGVIIPRRGTVHDLGRTMTHKAVIARKALQESKQSPTVAWETAHSVSSADRYLLDLMRVYISHKRWGKSPAETAFTTGMSLALVEEYVALIEELGLNDDQLPPILAQLEKSARARQGAQADALATSCEAAAQPSSPS
jgi:hypothetical protein